MSPPLPDPDSPFAEFAKPKESALEAFMQRRVQDRKSSDARRRFLFLPSPGLHSAADWPRALAPASVHCPGPLVAASAGRCLVRWAAGSPV
jgi:hypothetical protein